MKHLAIMILAALITTSFGYTALAQVAAPFEATVLQTARLRAGPGTTFAIVGSAAPGQVVNVAACNIGCTWFNLDTGSWIAAWLTKPIAESSSEPPTDDCDPAYPTVCIPPSPPDLDCEDISHKNFQVLQPDPHRFDGNGDGLGCEGSTANRSGNLRGGPGTGHPRVGGVTTGQALSITGRNAVGDWYQLASGAWIAAYLVNDAPANLPVVPGTGGGTPVGPGPTPTPIPAPECDPSYPTICIKPFAPDLDCPQIPYCRFPVNPPDPHGFDGDSDGVGCERC